MRTHEKPLRSGFSLAWNLAYNVVNLHRARDSVFDLNVNSHLALLQVAA